jgi:hypothetical protein
VRFLRAAPVVTIAIGSGLYVLACGNASVSPTPVAGASQVRSVEIVGPRVVPTGSDVTYSATAAMLNGVRVTNARPTAWTSDNPDVARILSAGDGIGELSAKREGTVSLTATHQGQAGTLNVDVRDVRPVLTGANLAVSYTPDPVPGRQMRCDTGNDRAIPTWTFTETIAETLGVGFTQENVSFTLYDDLGRAIYSDTFAENYYFPANSVFSEEFCSSLFGNPSGFYGDVYEGVDDLGNRRAFAGGRLRLLPITAARAPSSIFAAPTTYAITRGARQRIR